MRVRSRAAAMAAIALVPMALLVGPATAPACAAPMPAHGGSLPDAAYFRSTITSISPAVPGLVLTLERSGETITLTNHTGATVAVPGYTGEPYLRITPTGVEENTNSVSAFLNGSLVVEGLPQQLGSAQQPPAWRHVADSPSFSWHDHRVHWMAQQRPPVVAAAPSVPHPVFDWVVPLRVGDRSVQVAGSLTWLGTQGDSGWQRTGKLVMTSAALVALLALVLLGLRVRGPRRSRPAEPVAPDPVPR